MEITSSATNDLDTILLGIALPGGIKPTPFQILNDNEIDEITTQLNNGLGFKKPQIQRKRYNTQTRNFCSCGGLLEIKDSEIICNLCGITESQSVDTDASTSSTGSYNTSSESANPLRITGPGGMMFQKKLICKTSDYDKTRLRDTMSQMLSVADAYKTVVIPVGIVKEAGMRYYDVQRVCEIKRSDVRRGAMASCLMKICEKHGLHKKRTVFSEMFGIDSCYLSEGEKLLDRLFSEGKLNRDDFLVKNQENSRIQGYLVQLFISLGIPLPPDSFVANLGSDTKPRIPYNPDKPYFDFIKRLIDFTFHFKLAESSNIYSKCVGAIYVTTSRCPELGISPETIVKECNISRSTFLRFSNVIEKLFISTDPRESRLKNRLTHLFHKYNIIERAPKMKTN
jgi:hypothetical protein